MLGQHVGSALQILHVVRQETQHQFLDFLPYYMEDLQRGAYVLPEHTEKSLRHIFTMGAMREYVYENMPSMAKMCIRDRI